MATEEKQAVVEKTTVVPGKMEFRLISPTESNFLKHIEWNKEELLAAVRNKVALYEGIVYTEETVKLAKNDRAELNNLVKAIDERRKKVKEVINQPYAEFEKELKEIIDLIKKQSAEIDEQVKVFEAAEKEEKKAKIMEAYEKAIGNLAEILPFSKVFDQRYLNKTCKLASAIAEVQKKIEQVKTDLETIESVCGKYKLNATGPLSLAFSGRAKLWREDYEQLKKEVKTESITVPPSSFGSDGNGKPPYFYTGMMHNHNACRGVENEKLYVPKAR